MSDGDSGRFAVRMSHVQKFFGQVWANRDASLDVSVGEIHAVVGENGAGKSTLLRVLSGMYAPDGGTVEVFGKDVTGWSTSDAIAAGVGMVHQHFMLVPTLSVAENVVLGREPTSGLTYDRAFAESALEKLSRQTGLACVPSRLVSELSVGEAQRVEILKTLYRGAKLLILDEPTAVLSPPEVQELWKVLRTVRDNGATIVLVTHKLDELMDVTDRITVMRQGKTVTGMRTLETTLARLSCMCLSESSNNPTSSVPVGSIRLLSRPLAIWPARVAACCNGRTTVRLSQTLPPTPVRPASSMTTRAMLRFRCPSAAARDEVCCSSLANVVLRSSISLVAS